MNKLLVPLLFMLPIFYLAQGLVLNVGYDYMSRSAGYIGADYRFTSTHKTSFSAGAGTYVLSLDKKFTVLPEIHASYGSGLFGELSATTKNIKPTVGISLFNLFQLKMGYSFPFDKKDDLKGFTFGLHIFLGNSGFYDHLDINI